MKTDSCNLYQNWNLWFNLHQRNYVVVWVNCYGVTEIPVEQCFDDSKSWVHSLLIFVIKKNNNKNGEFLPQMMRPDELHVSLSYMVSNSPS